MTVGISPVYIQLTRRFVQNVGPKSLAKISEDSGVTLDQLHTFDRSGELDPLEVMKLWSMVFSERSFLEASALMDQHQFDPLRE